MTDETRIILDEIGTLKSSIDGIATKVDSLGNKVDSLENKVDSLENRVDGMESNIKDLQTNVKAIQVSLESETNRNIKLIAEGHLDLTRKLNEVLRVNAEQEMLPIRMNTLENEVRKLKERVEAIA